MVLGEIVRIRELSRLVFSFRLFSENLRRRPKKNLYPCESHPPRCFSNSPMTSQMVLLSSAVCLQLEKPVFSAYIHPFGFFSVEDGFGMIHVTKEHSVSEFMEITRKLTFVQVLQKHFPRKSIVTASPIWFVLLFLYSRDSAQTFCLQVLALRLPEKLLIVRYFCCDASLFALSGSFFSTAFQWQCMYMTPWLH